MQKHQLVRIGISTRIAAVERFDVFDCLAAHVIAHALQRQGKITLLQAKQAGVSRPQRFDIELFLRHDPAFAPTSHRSRKD